MVPAGGRQPRPHMLSPSPPPVVNLNRALGLHSMSNRAQLHMLSRLKRGRDIDLGLYLS